MLLKKGSSKVRKSSKVDNGIVALVKSVGSLMGPEIAINVKMETWQLVKWDGSSGTWKEHDQEINTWCPSKFLIMCLNTIQNGVQVEMPLFASSWGLEFWNSYANGSDLVDVDDDANDGGCKRVEKIAWVLSAAADKISMKEKEGVSFDGPFLLYIVPSQEKTYEVSQICKFLEVVGIQTLALHSGASIEHQIHSLKSYEPEFVVSTPERLLELLSLKAVNLSDVSLMIVDGLEDPLDDTTYLNALQSIRQSITGNPQTVVFCNSK
ncbi:P-loop containing nucleoside triphosphate hydrolases superfamily protein [Striga hermonthica]|uniref:P-loop containing nucleoside triphosphate hydrolases superfamily protein n=1 Tax=Striga hermonthica TaxID=68872 RepID=A0A9N7R6E5_STRHE|nr:P-loop containing nucleoside triphosphate hydrolases superfamily protein [Striga hermonthica]